MTIWVTTTVAVIAIALFGLAARVFAQRAIASITPNFDHGPSFPNMTIVSVAVTDAAPA